MRLGANPVLLRHLRHRPLIGRAEEHATTGGAARGHSASRVRSAVLGPGRGGLIQYIRSPMFPVRFTFLQQLYLRKTSYARFA